MRKSSKSKSAFYLPGVKEGEPIKGCLRFDRGDKIERIYGKRNGRKSIMLGIENGLALEHDIANVKHFAQRGIVYITLCHNGDNDICDSARGCNTHNGVSSFGEKVIHEMNRLGIMVDLSHGGEKSFYDARGNHCRRTAKE